MDFFTFGNYLDYINVEISDVFSNVRRYLLRNVDDRLELYHENQFFKRLIVSQIENLLKLIDINY